MPFRRCVRRALTCTKRGLSQVSRTPQSLSMRDFVERTKISLTATAHNRPLGWLKANVARFHVSVHLSDSLNRGGKIPPGLFGHVVLAMYVRFCKKNDNE